MIAPQKIVKYKSISTRNFGQATPSLPNTLTVEITREGGSANPEAASNTGGQLESNHGFFVQMSAHSQKTVA